MSISLDHQQEDLNQEIKQAASLIASVIEETTKRIVGQNHICQRLITAMIANGHVLLEGLPGLAKTTTIKTLAETAALEFKRIQFTPDLLPADVIGTQIYDPKSLEFKVKKGPIFAHLILADEINRAPAKVQSALLEGMEERQVTIGSHSFQLESPFLVLATQNPMEQEGTYPLPEAQVDRFLFKLLVNYPTHEEEVEVVRLATKENPVAVEKKINRHELRNLSILANKIFVSDKIRNYLVKVVFATRNPHDFGIGGISPYLEYGASPRASIALEKVARVHALIEGRSFVTPQDIKDVGCDILRHRLKLTYEAEAEGISADDVVTKIFAHVDVP